MQRLILNAFVALILISLAGCQSNQANPGAFNPFSTNYMTSSNLAQAVQEALMRSDDPAIAQVHVETRQAVVILTGYVKKIRQSDVAEQIARQVPGVQSVENNIIIRQ